MANRYTTSHLKGFLDGAVDPGIKAEFEETVLQGITSDEELIKATELIDAWKVHLFKEQMIEFHQKLMNTDSPGRVVD